jgi:hypothetical protein
VKPGVQVTKQPRRRALLISTTEDRCHLDQ